MRCYIAGPMRGIKLFNFPAFDEAKRVLEREDWEVDSPADFDREQGFCPEKLSPNHDWSVVPDTLNMEDCIDRDLETVRNCDAVFVLPGWKNSVGARAEVAVALFRKKQVTEFISRQNVTEIPAQTQKVNEAQEVPAPQAEVQTTAKRYNAGKPELSQLHHFRLDVLAAHCTAGRDKYPDVNGVPNWTLGGKPDAEYLDAAERHLREIVVGKVYDTETGTMHAAAVAWNVLAMVTNNMPDHPATQKEGGGDLV